MSRIVLITGATTGIGAATAASFQKSGYKVAVNYNRNDEQAQAFTNATGIPAYKWDVRDAQACLNGVHKIEQELGTVEVLVNNAGILRDKTIHKMTVEEWTDVITTNLNSCFNMSRAVVPSMKEKKFGRIIEPPPINESTRKVNPASLWTIYRRIGYGAQALHIGADHRSPAAG